MEEVSGIGRIWSLWLVSLVNWAETGLAYRSRGFERDWFWLQMITYFLPNLLQIAGYKYVESRGICIFWSSILYRTQTQKITLNFVNSVTSFIGALIGSAIVDYIGRRRLLLISTGSLVVLLAIASALLCDVNSHARGAAGISMIYLFMGTNAHYHGVIIWLMISQLCSVSDGRQCKLFTRLRYFRTRQERRDWRS